jgi:hypothetical protein
VVWETIRPWLSCSVRNDGVQAPPAWVLRRPPTEPRTYRQCSEFSAWRLHAYPRRLCHRTHGLRGCLGSSRYTSRVKVPSRLNNWISRKDEGRDTLDCFSSRTGLVGRSRTFERTTPQQVRQGIPPAPRGNNPKKPFAKRRKPNIRVPKKQGLGKEYRAFKSRPTARRGDFHLRQAV